MSVLRAAGKRKKVRKLGQVDITPRPAGEFSRSIKRRIACGVIDMRPSGGSMISESRSSGPFCSG